MTTPSSTPQRKRGAPPGNQNARKHGLTPRQKNPLYSSDKSAAIDLLPEIEIMRHHIADLSDAAIDLAALPEKLETLRLLTLAVTALTRLVRAQALVFSNDTNPNSPESPIGQYLSAMKRYLRTRDKELLTLLCHAPTDDDSRAHSTPFGEADNDDEFHYTDIMDRFTTDEDEFDDEDDIPPYMRNPPPAPNP